MPKPKSNEAPRRTTNEGPEMITADPEAELARALAVAKEGVAAAFKVVTDLAARIQAADAAVETTLAAHRALVVQLGSGGVVADADLAQVQGEINAAKDHAAALRGARGTANTALVAANRVLHIAAINNARRHLGPAVKREAELREELALVNAWLEEMRRAMMVNDASAIEVAAAKRPACLILLDGADAPPPAQRAESGGRAA